MTSTELSNMISLAERLLAAKETAVLATLFCSNGPTYRPLGSMMVSGPGAISAGGVSGGCVEEYVARHGREIVQHQPAAMLSFDADPDADDGKPSLGCGGSIEVLVERLTHEHLAFLRCFDEAHHADAHSTAACIVDTELTVHRIWLDSHSDFEALRLQVIETEQSRCGIIDATRRALVHYIPPMTRLVILGAGDDARPLCTLARSLGWHVTVADRRGRLATRNRFADADEVIAADWATSIARITFTPRTAVVMMTHSLADDIEMLPLLAERPMGYVGALGPAHRRQWVLDGAGVNGNFAVRFRGPIGLNLGDRSAAGIAVSIVSEILATLNARDAAPLSSPAPLADSTLTADA